MIRETRKSRKIAILKAGLLALLLAGALYAASQENIRELFDPTALGGHVERAGVTGYLIFAALFLLSTLMLMPPTLFTISGGLLFGPFVGLAFSVIMVNIGGVILFALARALGREGVQRYLPKRLAALDERLERRGFLTVVLLRLVFVPFGVVCVSAGVSSIRTRDYLLGTAVGTFPASFLFAWLGSAALEILHSHSLMPLLSWTGLVAALLFAAAVALPFVLERRSRAKALPPTGNTEKGE